MLDQGHQSDQILGMMMNRRVFCCAGLMSLLISSQAIAAPLVPKLNIGLDAAKGPNEISASLQVLVILTVLSLAPALIIMVTSFTRIIIVLSFVRTALGTQQVPPNAVLIGLALFLTFFTMSPVWVKVNHNALQPYIHNEISFDYAMTQGAKPVRDFMFMQTREKDLGLFVELAHIGRPLSEDAVPTHVLIPAFIISELRTAFSMGFLIFIPFLIIDMVISIILMSMGMMMLPPVLISLPFKILLFIMVDGWYLVVKSLVMSFR